jgi:hypothetical protein
MSLNIKNEETHRRACRKADAVNRLLKIGRECAALPIFDRRTPDQMLYDKNGLPK